MKKWNLREKSWEIAAILLCVLVMTIGVSRKEGYHMDELLSFELANAQFNPWIVPTQPQGRLAKFVENEIQGETASETFENIWNTGRDVLANRGNSKLLSYQADVYEEPVWITAEQFQKYITVDEKDDFQYASVYFNVKDDNHPPLHFALLHTISSVFKGKINPFMGCSINLFAMVGILLLLIRVGNQLAELFGFGEHARLAGVLAALCYGLSTGALATVLLIRMYGVVSFFCVALFSICLEKWKNNGFEKKNFYLIAVTVCGFLTQYFFLFYCIPIVLLLLCLLFSGKRMREGVCLMRSMMIAAAVGLLSFPFAIADVFSSGRGVEALENLAAGFSGYGERLLAFLRILCDRTFGVAGILIAVAAVVCVVWLCKKGKNVNRKKQIEAVLLLVVPVAGYFLLASRMSPYLVDRYIMPLFPFVTLVGAFLLTITIVKSEQCFVKTESKKKLAEAAVCILVILLQGGSLLCYDGTYLYKGYAAQEQLAEEYANIPCICVYEGVGYYENLPEFTHYQKTLLVKPSELLERKDKASVEELSGVVVLVKPGADSEQVSAIMKAEYGFAVKEQLLADGVHGDRIFLFEK